MKKIVILLYICIFAFNVKSQTYEQRDYNYNNIEYTYEKQYNGDIKVYEYRNHIKSNFPVKIMVKQMNGSYLVYKVNKYGIRNNMPEGKISKNNTTW